MSNAKDNKKATGGTKAATSPTASKAAKDKEKTPQVSTDAGKTKAQQNSDKQTTGGEVASLGTQGKEAATGTQGTDADNQVTDKDLQIAANIVSGLAALAKSEPKATTEKRERIAKDLFAKKSGLSVIYFTSDFMPFGTENDAKQHASKLDNKIVTPITKED